MHYKIKNNQVEFVFPVKRESLYLKGTFTNWQVDEAFRFENRKNGCQLIKKIDEVNKIGNSGFIEYVIWDDDVQAPVEIAPLQTGHYFNNQSNGGFNQLLFLNPPSQRQLQEISKASEQSFLIKNQIEQFASNSELANFRAVTGGQLKPGGLYRSYHPVTPSRSHHAELKTIEPLRQAAAMSLIEEHRIQSVVNLSDSEQVLVHAMASAPDSYYKRCWQHGHVYSVPVAYETVYFMSDCNQALNNDELGFQDGIRGLIRAIACSQGPYLVHCRLGSDRTGVMCAFLQLMAGASKQQIADNYLMTNQLGIGEYRSFRLLERALTAALGEACFSDGIDATTIYMKRLDISDKLIKQARTNLFS
ncbi:tyrosine-protein phosphatase [Photobacterium gaetbulicola]|nr:tyrosine-protein phosphatase [Photobacterium gaetbulicola]